MRLSTALATAWLALQACYCCAFGSSSFNNRISLTHRNMVESVSVQSIFDEKDVDQFGEEMSLSIQTWLDNEWLPQDIHKEIGDSCKQSFLQCHEDGVSDVMAIMMKIVDDLQEDWYTKYDKDAFVNPFDISNYVSDFLIKRSGMEGCECSNSIY